MTSFCDARPTDPSCPAAEGSNGRSGADRIENTDNESVYYMVHEASNPFRGNLSYLGTALMLSVQSGLHLFRYYNEADYADGYVLSADFNYWAWTFKATKATQFSISSILALT